MRKVTPAGIATVAVIYGLSRYSYGLFVPQFQKAFPGSLERYGLIASSSYGAYMIATLVVPGLATRFGPKIPLLMGGILAIVGMFLIGISSNIFILATGVVIAGASPGLAYPPLPEVVRPVIDQRLYHQALTLMNSGTGWGVLLTGPVALWAGSQWRYAWLGFSGVALMSTLWNWRVFPNPSRASTITNGLPKVDGGPTRGVGGLLVLAALVGIATSVFWTYSVELLTVHANVSSSGATLFWTVVGISGIAGAFGGHFSNRYGFPITFRITLIGLTLSLGILPFWPSALGMFVSAVLFGLLFIMVTGLLAIWSVTAFPSRPSIGYSAVFFLITAGQFAGPILMGWIASHWSLPTAFYTATAISACMLLVPIPKQSTLIA